MSASGSSDDESFGSCFCFALFSLPVALFDNPVPVSQKMTHYTLLALLMPYCVSQEACACLYINSAIVVAFPLVHARVHCHQAEDVGHGRLFLLLSQSGPPTGTPGDVAEGITVTPQPRDYYTHIFKDAVTAAQCSTASKYTHEQGWEFCRVQKGIALTSLYHGGGGGYYVGAPGRLRSTGYFHVVLHYHVAVGPARKSFLGDACFRYNRV